MRRKQVLIGFGVVAGALGSIVAAGAADAQVPPPNVVCRGTLANVTVDNVEVPDFATCSLQNVRVLGSVEAGLRSRLTVADSTVAGNVQGNEATAVTVLRTSVTGSVQITQGGVARVQSNVVAGDILVDGQRNAVTVTGNRVGTGVAGNVELFGNLGGTTVRGNRIAGNLSCKDNLPAPVGGANIVTGNKEDQCLLL